MNFVHLHVHSHYSTLDGMSKVPDIVDKCIRTGMPAVALTDHGNMYGIKEFLDYCKSVNQSNEAKWKETHDASEPFVPFKPIVGIEAYCAHRSRRSMTSEQAIWPDGVTYQIDKSGWHLILLAKNELGYRNLCKLTSAGFMDDAFYSRPRIDKELLERYHEGVIACSACLGGEISQKILHGDLSGAEQAVQWFKQVFGEDYYLELQRHQTDKPNGNQETYQEQLRVNPVLIELARKYDIKLICTNDSHFLDEQNADAHEHLICISTNQKITDQRDKMRYTKQEWLKTPEEMARIFDDIPEALANTLEIADKVEIYDIDRGPIMPKFDIPASFGNEEDYPDRLSFESAYLRHLTMQGALQRYGQQRLDTDEVLKERIEFELNTIISMGFPGYFLIVMDFIRAAREELDVSVGPGRGSAAGSGGAYCLKITDLDPLEYDLLFERFLNPDRISLPDIDTDFEDSGRGKVLDWVSQKYGATHVAHIITYGKMATRSALADVARVEGVSIPVSNQLKSYVPARDFPDSIKDDKGKKPKVNLRNCYKYIDELRAIYEGDDPVLHNTLEYAAQLEDTIRQVGVHACGVIIGADDLTKFAPLASVLEPKTQKRVLVTQYDGHVVESVGLIKMDFLGLITLSIIKECIRTVKRTQGVDIDINHIPLDDELTYKLFQEGRTVAVFQFESSGMRSYMRQLKPTVMGDLIAMNALYRPGPMDYIPQFIRRKHGIEQVTYDIPVMEKYLKDTYGVTVYQEQVMLLSRLLANFTRGESDKLRKAMGKKQMKILQELKGKFMTGGKANGYDPKILDKIWADWEKFASYAFNKSHAACYSWVAYQTAYLKAHYPSEFMAANLTILKNSTKDVTRLMDECTEMNIRVLEPDVNESGLNFTANAKGDIRFGLGGVKGVGENAVEAIVTEREKNGKYRDIYDFVERVNLTACNKKTIESLAYAGAFDCFSGLYREQLLGINSRGESVLDTLVRYGNLYQQNKADSQFTLFGAAELEVDIQKPELPVVPRMTNIERLNKEKEMIGIYLSAHPLDDYEFEVRELCSVTAEELKRFRDWEKPDQRAAAISQFAQGGNDDEGEETETAVETIITSDADGELVTEEKEVPAESAPRPIRLSPEEWIHAHEKRQLTVGGIITASEERTSQKGTLYGKYTIEDYTGSYEFLVFGDDYKRFAPLLKKDVYAYVTVQVQPRGWGGKFYKEVPFAEAEYECRVKDVQLLQDAQKNRVHSLTLTMPVDKLTEAWAAEFQDICRDANDDDGLVVRFRIEDSLHHNGVTLTARTVHIRVTKPFYHWLRTKSNDRELVYNFK
jgi:DNA-directed DNA polymerase III (polc)